MSNIQLLPITDKETFGSRRMLQEFGTVVMTVRSGESQNADEYAREKMSGEARDRGANAIVCFQRNEIPSGFIYMGSAQRLEV